MYVGIPFVEHGRSDDGLDCWGLVQKVQMEQFSTFLPSFDGHYTKITKESSNEILTEALSSLPIEKTEAPAEGDIVLMKMAGIPAHVGVYCVVDGVPMVLHEDPIGRSFSRLSRITDPVIAPRIEGYYHVI